MKLIDLTGKTFGRLTVVSLGESQATRGGNKKVAYNCTFSCGQKCSVISASLRSGATSSCGCLEIEARRSNHRTHGHSVGRVESKTLKCYWNMIARCYNPRSTAFPDYGARGIKVCDRWRESFENFMADMGEVPEGMSIERKDVNGNYDPGNCRWATDREQHANKRSTRFLEIGGVRLPVFEWAEKAGISRLTITDRLRWGWDAKRAVFDPVRRRAA